MSCRTVLADWLRAVVAVKETLMFWAFVFVMMVWLWHLVIRAGSLLKTVNLLLVIAIVCGAPWLLWLVLSRRRGLPRSEDASAAH